MNRVCGKNKRKPSTVDIETLTLIGVLILFVLLTKA